jgi:hypothetical protein
MKKKYVVQIDHTSERAQLLLWLCNNRAVRMWPQLRKGQSCFTFRPRRGSYKNIYQIDVAGAHGFTLQQLGALSTLFKPPPPPRRPAPDSRSQLF